MLLTTNSPFNPEQADLLNRLLPTLTDEQKIWLSGYLTAFRLAAAANGGALAANPAAQAGASAALAVLAAPSPAAAPAAGTAASTAPAISKEVTVLFGSQTGNSQKLAKQLAARLQESGFEPKVSAMNEFKPNTLKKVETLFIITSTHGEGDPPDNAISFYEFLHSKRAPRLEGMRFSVLALGDTSYEHFCKTGKDFDKRLEELGAQRLVERADCDVDFEQKASEWIGRVAAELEALAGAGARTNGQAAGFPAAGSGAVAFAGTGFAVPGISGVSAAAAATAWSRSRPFHATVLENLNLNGRGSAKETRHVELSLEGSGLTYEPGDSLGVYPENRPDLVQELIEEMGWKEDDIVPLPSGAIGAPAGVPGTSGGPAGAPGAPGAPGATGPSGAALAPLAEALIRHYDLATLTKDFVQQVAERTGSRLLRDMLVPDREQELRQYLKGRDLLDFVRDFELRGVPAGELVPLLRKQAPRLYSIASSLKAFPEEAHLTVRRVFYEAHGRKRYGVCSNFIAERLQPGDTVPVFVQENPNFRLPQDPDTPIIMVGPGTGAAPFRAFLGEREETGASGKSWLFFGDQHFLTDFLYQVEWQRWLKDGVLTRMDVAFSRDTERKIYVQHRMLEHGKELYRWLQEGAVIYVCGDKDRMAKDVHSALAAILEQEGGMDAEQAEEYLKQLQAEKRYQRDVY